MNVNSLKCDLNCTYMTEFDFATKFSPVLKMDMLSQELESFRKKPVAEGKILTGNRTSIKLFVPDITFPKDKVPHGEKLWAYFGAIGQYYVLSQ